MAAPLGGKGAALQRQRRSGGTKALTLSDSLHAPLGASVHYRTLRHPMRGSTRAVCPPMSDVGPKPNQRRRHAKAQGPGIARQFPGCKRLGDIELLSL
jgi:hypothetical protein